jgi:hypothetical protein
MQYLPSNFILHDMIIKDTKTKKLYTFNASDTTRTIVDSELVSLTDDEISDIKNANELNTSYLINPKKHI